MASKVLRVYAKKANKEERLIFGAIYESCFNDKTIRYAHSLGYEITKVIRLGDATNGYANVDVTNEFAKQIVTVR